MNQRMKASQVNPPAPNLTDMGWVAMRIGVSVPRTLWSIDVVDREAMVKVCGVAMAKLQGQSWVPHLSNGERMNVQNHFDSSLPSQQPAGWREDVSLVDAV